MTRARRPAPASARRARARRIPRAPGRRYARVNLAGRGAAACTLPGGREAALVSLCDAPNQCLLDPTETASRDEIVCRRTRVGRRCVALRCRPGDARLSSISTPFIPISTPPRILISFPSPPRRISESRTIGSVHYAEKSCLALSPVPQAQCGWAQRHDGRSPLPAASSPAGSAITIATSGWAARFPAA